MEVVEHEKEEQPVDPVQQLAREVELGRILKALVEVTCELEVDLEEVLARV